MLSPPAHFAQPAGPLFPAPLRADLSYPGKASELSIDFVATSAIGSVTVEHPQGTFTQVNSTSFHFAQIGYMHQALLQFPGIAPGQTASYTVTSAGETTPAFTVVPDVSGPEKHVVRRPPELPFGTCNSSSHRDDPPTP